MERIKILQEADHIFISELNKNNLYEKIWQAYAALLPIRTVGVMDTQGLMNTLAYLEQSPLKTV